VGTNPESAVDALTVVEAHDDITGAGPAMSNDIFVSARSPRRELVPASLRLGRPRGKHARKAQARRAQARANHPCHGPRMYLLEDLDLDDHDGLSETTRIDLRRQFEDPAAPLTTSGSEDLVAG
jgi:hypothetical protein